MRQVRRAWLVLAAATTLFLLLSTSAAFLARFVYVHATEPHVASVEIVSGSAALYRQEGQTNWLLIDEDSELREGDEISTALGTVVRIRTFDGSVIEVSEDTLVRIDRMRSSRFLDRTKEIQLTLRSGTVYIEMEPHQPYSYAEFTVQAYQAIVTMSDEPSRMEAGVFLVEVLPDGTVVSDGSRETPAVRVATLSGAAMLESRPQELKLREAEQVIVSPSGTPGDVTEPFRQLIANGQFTSDLTSWSVYRRSSIPGAEPTGAQLELQPSESESGEFIAVRFHRPDEYSVPVTIGIRQRVGQTIQSPGSMELRMDLKIDAQNPPGGGEGANTFPIVFTLHYVDENGEDQELTRGYYTIAEGVERVPALRGSQVQPGIWQRIVFNLNDLTPAPQQIDSILVYASGVSFDASVANISLTTREQLVGER